MTTKQFKQLMSKLDELIAVVREADASSEISSIDTDVAEIKRDVGALREFVVQAQEGDAKG